MPITNSADFRSPSEIIAGANPTLFAQILAEHTYYDGDRAYTDDTFLTAINEEYAANQEAYDEYSFFSADPNRGLTPYNFDNFTGVNPGVTIDIEKYGPSEQQALDQQKVREMADYYRGLDANRWALNPDDLGPIDTYAYEPATANIHTTDIGDTFDPTLGQLDYANQLNDYAATLDGSHLGSAADLQYAAASGKTPLVSDLRLNRDRDSLYAQQASLAARARGASGAGLAVLNAQNNQQLGYLGLVQAADLARAQEMSDARSAYAQTGSAIRQGDLSAAGQAANLGQQYYQVGNSQLGVAENNTQQLNAGEQYNTGISNTAGQWNAQNATDTAKYNTDNVKDILDKNRVAGMTTETGDRGLTQAYDQTTLAEERGNQELGVRGEEDYQQAVGDISSILGNIYSGNANNRTTLEGIDRQADAQEQGALIGAVGAGLGALTSMSDRRRKDIHGEAEPADFSRVHDYDWSYKDDVPPEDDWLNDGSTKSGMAQDFPDDLVFKDEEGNLRVNAMKALLRYAGSIGDLQRRVEKVEKQ